MRLTAPRAAHQREGHERFTLDAILAEEVAVMDLVDARDDRTQLWVKDDDTAGLSPDQKDRGGEHRRVHRGWCNRCRRRPVRARPPRCAPCAPPRTAATARVLVLAPTGKAVDVAVREGAGDEGLTIAKALHVAAQRHCS